MQTAKGAVKGIGLVECMREAGSSSHDAVEVMEDWGGPEDLTPVSLGPAPAGPGL